MQDIVLYIGGFLMSIVCGFIFIPIIIHFCLDKKLYDQPDYRKIHKNPIPRLGGISFVPSMLTVSVIVLFIMNHNNGKAMHVSLWSLYFCISLFIIYFVGIIDDLIGLNATVKFSIEIIAAAIMPLSGLYANNLYGLFGIHDIPFMIAAPLTILVMVFTCNAINLIDGIDGLAASLTIIALAGFFTCFLKEDMSYYYIMIISLIGVLVSYLYYNMFGSIEKKRKIFMGDSGSLSLGFILGFLAIKYCMNTPDYPYASSRIMWSWTFLAVPCFDVVRVFFYRIIHGQSPFHPDKNHIHHKLMACGLSQHQALIVIVSLQLLLIVGNAVLSDTTSISLIFIIDIIAYLLANTVINLVMNRRKVALS